MRGLQETAARLAAAAAAAPPARMRERVLAEAARTRQLPPARDRAGRRAVARPLGGAARWRARSRLAAGGGARRGGPGQAVRAALTAAFPAAAVAFGSWPSSRSTG